MSIPRDQFLLRLPRPLKRNVKKLARANKKSMTAEIQSALEVHTRQFGAKTVEVR